MIADMVIPAMVPGSLPAERARGWTRSHMDTGLRLRCTSFNLYLPQSALQRQDFYAKFPVFALLEHPFTRRFELQKTS
jgi:hypothetical protein